MGVGPLIPDSDADASGRFLSPAMLFPIDMFGARDDGSNSYAAIVAAHAAARAAEDAGDRAAVVFPPSLVGWSSATPVSILDVDVLMYGPLIYTGTGAQAAPALTVGGTLYAFGRDYRIMVKRATRDWSTATDVGCRIQNVQYAADINLVSAEGFTIGFQAMGDGQGFVYNTIMLGTMYDCRCGLELTNKSNGWNNENLWLGGSFRNSSSTFVATSRTGIRITSADGLYPSNNNNVFLKPSIEVGPTNGLPIDIVHGIGNSFIAARTEGNRSDYAAITRNLSQHNEFDFGFATLTTTVLDEGSFASSIVRRGLSPQGTRQAHSTPFSIGTMSRYANGTDGAGSVGVAGMTAMTSGNAFRWLGVSSITIGAGFVSVPSSRALGVFIDTSVVKQFRVNVRAAGVTAGRIFVQPYDAADVKLDNLGGGHPYVKGTSASQASWSASFGGCYVTGSDGKELFFGVGPTVAYVFVGVTGGASAIQMTGLTIEGLEPGHTSSWTHRTPQHGTFAKYATAIPTVGTYEDGDVIWNDAPAAGGTPGWVCTTPGGPGTFVFKAMANLAA